MLDFISALCRMQRVNEDAAMISQPHSASPHVSLCAVNDKYFVVYSRDLFRVHSLWIVPGTAQED